MLALKLSSLIYSLSFYHGTCHLAASQIKQSADSGNSKPLSILKQQALRRA
jgi:hypothetical protein